MGAEREFGVTSLVERAPGLLQNELAGDLLVANSETGNFYGFREGGRRIWELLAERTTLAELCETLGREFDADRTTLEGDLFEFLRELARLGLIRILE